MDALLVLVAALGIIRVVQWVMPTSRISTRSFIAGAAVGVFAAVAAVANWSEGIVISALGIAGGVVLLGCAGRLPPLSRYDDPPHRSTTGRDLRTRAGWQPKTFHVVLALPVIVIATFVIGYVFGELFQS